MLTKTIPSYLYTEYADDSDLQGFVDAYNSLSQEQITWFATVGLPIYTGLSGQLLDWVAAGLYGLYRPVVPTSSSKLIGPINTWTPNEIPINSVSKTNTGSFALASDDVFKRMMTWYLFKGDGFQFSTLWLKKRITRFLFGVNGVNYNIGQTYQASVQFGGGNEVMIHIEGPVANNMDVILAYCIKSGITPLPFQYSFDVSLT